MERGTFRQTVGAGMMIRFRWFIRDGRSGIKIRIVGIWIMGIGKIAGIEAGIFYIIGCIVESGNIVILYKKIDWIKSRKSVSSSFGR